MLKRMLHFKKIIVSIVVLGIVVVGGGLFLIRDSLNLSKAGNSTSNVINGSLVTNDKDWIYYSDGSYKLYKMKNDGSNETEIMTKDKLSYDELNKVDDWIYYKEVECVNEADKEIKVVNRIYKIKTDGTQKTKIIEEDVSYHNININGNEIYYICTGGSSKGYSIYKMKTDGAEKTELVHSQGTNIDDLNVVGDWIYYKEYNSYTKQDKIYKVKTDGSKKTEIASSDGRAYYEVYVVGNWIYYIGADGIGKMKTDGTHKTSFKNEYVKVYNNINISGDWIYYIGKKTKGGEQQIYRMKTDGSSRNQEDGIKLESGGNYKLNVVNNWIFYTNYNKEMEVKIYRMKTDGSMKSEIKKSEYRE